MIIVNNKYRYEIIALLKAGNMRMVDAAELCGIRFEKFCDYINGHTNTGINEQLLLEAIRRRVAVMQQRGRII